MASKYKNIKIPKRGGGTRLQRVQVLASGKYKFVKNLVKSRSRSSRKTQTTKRKKKRNNPKKGGNRRMGRNLQATIFKWLRIGALAAPGVIVAVGPGKPDQKANEAFRLYTGVNVKHSMESGNLEFDWRRLAMGWSPFLAAVLTTYGIPKIAGIIRRL